MIDDLEERRKVDAEFERKRRRELGHVAWDMLAAHFGHAEWQDFRNREPLAFLRAKLDVQGAPPDLWLALDWKDYDRSEVVCWFEWSAVGGVQRLLRAISFRELTRDEDDGFLRYCANWMASEVGRASGVTPKITLRGNRAAYEWHEQHKGDPAPPRPRELPPEKRIFGSFCGACKAKLDLEKCGVFNETMPCGHPWSVGCYETEVTSGDGEL